MAVTYRGKSNRKRFLEPEEKFKAKEVPLVVPMVAAWEKIEEIRQAPEVTKVIEPVIVKPEPIVIEPEPVVDDVEKPKKRGRPKKLSVKSGGEDEMRGSSNSF